MPAWDKHRATLHGREAVKAARGGKFTAFASTPRGAARHLDQCARLYS